MKIQYMLAASLLGLTAFASPAIAQEAEIEADDGSAANGNTILNDNYFKLIFKDNGDNRDNITGSNLDSVVGSNYAVAKQELKAVNINSYLDEVVDMDGEDGSETPVGYNSGDNYVRGNAFAAFAGISNNAWNTGINANTQAATNIAAVGQVSFGVGCCDAGNGGGGGDD